MSSLNDWVTHTIVYVRGVIHGLGEPLSLLINQKHDFISDPRKFLFVRLSRLMRIKLFRMKDFLLTQTTKMLFSFLNCCFTYKVSNANARFEIYQKAQVHVWNHLMIMLRYFDPSIILHSILWNTRWSNRVTISKVMDLTPCVEMLKGHMNHTLGASKIIDVWRVANYFNFAQKKRNRRRKD